MEYCRFENDLSAQTSEYQHGNSETEEASEHPTMHSSSFYNVDNTETRLTLFADPSASFEKYPDTRLGKARWKVRKVVENFWVRLFSVLLVLADISIIISDLVLVTTQKLSYPSLSIISLTIVCYFMLELSLRLFAMWRDIFHHWYNIVDAVVVLVSFIINVVFVTMELVYTAEYAKLVIGGRAVVRIVLLVRVLLIARLYPEKKRAEKAARKLVSENKRRYCRDGFDLDLTFVTERIIAMSFPSSGKQQLYRNPITEVARFFNTKYPAHYKVYNLCSENNYDGSYFDNRTERVLIDDHNVPRLSDIISFCNSVRDWMNADAANIIAVHCKGGKGRTGTMICAWLLDCDHFQTADESLCYFAERRTDLSEGEKFQGVETPSQSRYVNYYEKIKHAFHDKLPDKKKLQIRTVTVFSVSQWSKNKGRDLLMEIVVDGRTVFECDFQRELNCQVQYENSQDCITVQVLNCPILVDDVKIRFKSTTNLLPNNYDDCPFFFWFNTSFISDLRLYLPREEIDNPHKKKTWKYFNENFAIELQFHDLTLMGRGDHCEFVEG